MVLPLPRSRRVVLLSLALCCFHFSRCDSFASAAQHPDLLPHPVPSYRRIKEWGIPQGVREVIHVLEKLAGHRERAAGKIVHDPF